MQQFLTMGIESPSNAPPLFRGIGLGPIERRAIEKCAIEKRTIEKCA